MALEKGEEIHAVFLDLSKAYDRVSIPGQLYKLSSLGLTDSTMQWLTFCLTNREQRVRVDGCLSLPQVPKSGTPQGTVLGPILFLGYINDLPRSTPSECSIFADDTSTFKTGRNSQLICSRISRPFPCHRLGHCLGIAIQCRKERIFNYLNKTEQYQQATCLWTIRKSHKSLLTNIWGSTSVTLFLGRSILTRSTHHAPNELAWSDVWDGDFRLLSCKRSLSAQSSLNWSMHVLCGVEVHPKTAEAMH